MEEKTLSLSGGGLHVTQDGTGGTPVLMLHGGGPGSSGMSNFRPCVPKFAATSRTIVPDQPGFGRSQLPAFTGSYLDLSCRSMIEMMDALGLERVHVIGNSLGGGVGLTMARDFPDRVDRLILMNPAGASVPLFNSETAEIGMIRDYYSGDGPSIERMRTFAHEMVYSVGKASEDMILERYENSLLPGANEGMSAALRTFDPRLESSEAAARKSAALWTQLQEIQHRVLLMWGREDRAAPLDRAWFILARMPNVELHVMPHCGHWVQLEEPELFHGLSRLFLEDAKPGLA
jgi:4,5:9,10-diseco-3-hydroxy-5,9,17-trioxoandrosta-1(10),2-diene-4-oate hydrolase